MGLTILHIEDDEEIALWVRDFFTERGYEVIWLKTGHHALEHMEQTDVVIMDIMLPGLDGFTVGQRMKQDFPETPVMMLTARTSMEDKLQGLAFADDYMTKPYHPDELEARIHVLLRRFGAASPDHIELKHLRIERKANRILNSRMNKEIILTGKQFYIFMYFLDHPNQILTQKQIYEAVWEDSFIKGDRTLMVHIRHLREKIEIDSSCPQIIETIRGIGYRLRT